MLTGGPLSQQIITDPALLGMYARSGDDPWQWKKNMYFFDLCEESNPILLFFSGFPSEHHVSHLIFIYLILGFGLQGVESRP